MVVLHWKKYMQHILEKYNSIYKVQMPKITLTFAGTRFVLTWQKAE